VPLKRPSRSTATSPPAGGASNGLVNVVLIIVMLLSM
jgi:hypothetical protein